VLKAEACYLRLHNVHKRLVEGKDCTVLEVKEATLTLEAMQCPIMEGD